MHERVQQIIKLITIGVLCGNLQACSNWTGDGNAVSDKVERASVVVWAPEQSPGADAVMREHVATFNADQRNVQIELKLMPEREYMSQLQQARNEQTLPGVICLELAQFQEYVESDLLQPLEKMMSQRLWNDLLPDLLEQGHIGTHMYGLPAMHTAKKDWLWTVVDDAKDKSATMAFIHYLLHPERQKPMIATGSTEAVTYSALN